MYRKVRMVVEIALYNFRQWRGNIRIISAFILAFILCFLLSDQIIIFAKNQNTTLQIVEAFVWTFGDSTSILLVSLLLLLFYSDMPFLSSATPFYLVRANRKIWVLGQLVYIILSTIIYILFIFLSTCILCIKYSFVKNTWSRTSAILAYSEEGKQLVLPAAVKTLEMSRPYSCTATIMFLMILYTLVMVFIMMLFCIWKGIKGGIISVIVFSTYGELLKPEYLQRLWGLPEELYYKARVFVGWISPLNHATYHMHNFGYDDLPTISQTSYIFGGILVLLLTFTIFSMRKFSFQFRGIES